MFVGVRALIVVLTAIGINIGKEFCSWAMLTWAHVRGAQLFLIEPGKPNQNAYIESFNGRMPVWSAARYLLVSIGKNAWSIHFVFRSYTDKPDFLYCTPIFEAQR